MSSMSGVAVRASGAGMTLGTALEDYAGSGPGQILVYVHVGYYDPLGTQSSGVSGGAVLQGGNGTLSGLTVSGQGGSLLTVDASSNSVTIGAGVVGETTPKLLVLDNGTAGDPSEVNGAMYYSADQNEFRCGQNGAWVSCTGLVYSSTSSSSTLNVVGTAAPFSNYYTLPANDCQTGVTYMITAGGRVTISQAGDQVRFYLYESNLNSGIIAQTRKMEPTISTGTFNWTANLTVTCTSATSVIVSGPLSIEGNNGDAVTTYQGSYDVLTTAGTPSNNWSSGASNFGLGANIISGGSSNDSIVLDQFTVQRLGS